MQGSASQQLTHFPSFGTSYLEITVSNEKRQSKNNESYTSTGKFDAL